MRGLTKQALGCNVPSKRSVGNPKRAGWDRGVSNGTGMVKSAVSKRRTQKGTARGRRARPPQRVARASDTPKGRILTAAAELFQTRGFAQTTVRELAAAVGIQSGSLFHHFRSKEEILEAVMMEVIELNTQRMRDALIAAGTPLARLHNLVLAELTSVTGETSQAMSLLLMEWRSLPDDAKERVLVLRDAYERLWLDTLVAAKGELLPGKPLVQRRLIGGMTAHSASWFDLRGRMTLEDLTAQIMAMVTRRGAA